MPISPPRPAPSPRPPFLTPMLGGVALGLPILLSAYPPMTDFPFHEMAVALLRHRGESAWDVPGVYASNWGHPNQLFYLLAYGLSLAVPVLWACKVLVFASIVALPMAVERFRRFVAAPPHLTTAACIFAYGYVFYWGLVPNLLAFPALVLATPPLIAHGLAPSPRSTVASIVWLTLLYFAHEAMFVAGLGVLGAAWLVSSPRTHELGAKLLPGIVTAGVVLAKHLLPAKRTIGTYMGRALVFDGPGERLHDLPTVVAGPHGWWAAVGLTALVVVACIAFSLGERSAEPPSDKRRQAVLVAGILLFMAYFLCPTGVWGTNLIHQRFLPPALLLLAGAASSGVTGQPRVADLLAASSVAASLLLAVPEFLLAQDSFLALSRLAPHLQKGSAMTTLGFVNPSAHASLVYGQYCHLTAEGGGRSAYDISSSPISPIVRREDHSWDEPYRLTASPEIFPVETIFGVYRYFFAWIEDPRVEEVLTQALSPEARFVAREGNWLLYESQGPVVSLETPDALLPRPRGRRLGPRLRAIIDGLPLEVQRAVANRLGVGGSYSEEKARPIPSDQGTAPSPP